MPRKSLVPECICTFQALNEDIHFPSPLFRTWLACYGVRIDVVDDPDGTEPGWFSAQNFKKFITAGSLNRVQFLSPARSLVCVPSFLLIPR